MIKLNAQVIKIYKFITIKKNMIRFKWRKVNFVVKAILILLIIYQTIIIKFHQVFQNIWKIIKIKNLKINL